MLTIVVPIGGGAKRFQERGYTFPKPLVEIAGKPMIEIVARNLAPRDDHRFVFVARQEDLSRWALREVLDLVDPGCRIVPLRNPTSGALCSVLLAMEEIDPDSELLVANGDQFLDLDMGQFLDSVRSSGADGGIVTFPSKHPKWSFVREENGEVVQVAEKRPISEWATAGIYWYRRASDFLRAAERSIVKNAGIEGQFYVCPVYNEMILEGKRIVTHRIAREAMHSLGTPEDVEIFASDRARAGLEVRPC